MYAYLPVVSVSFMTNDGEQLPFTLQYYGIPVKEFHCVPSPMVPIMKESLRRRGYDPEKVWTSPFMCKQVW